MLLAFHNSRHTFATLQIALGTDIYTVSKMLTHKSVKTTQIYARIVDQTVSREMDKLSAALSGTRFSLNGENEAADPSTQEIAN